MSDGDIALIPRARGKMSAKEKAEYAKKKTEEQTSKDLQDYKYVKNAAYGYKEKINADRRALGLREIS